MFPQKLAWIDSAKLLFTLQHISKRIPENVLGDNSGKLVSCVSRIDLNGCGAKGDGSDFWVSGAKTVEASLCSSSWEFDSKDWTFTDSSLPPFKMLWIWFVFPFFFLAVCFAWDSDASYSSLAGRKFCWVNESHGCPEFQKQLYSQTFGQNICNLLWTFDPCENDGSSSDHPLAETNSQLNMATASLEPWWGQDSNGCLWIRTDFHLNGCGMFKVFINESKGQGPRSWQDCGFDLKLKNFHGCWSHAHEFLEKDARRYAWFPCSLEKIHLMLTVPTRNLKAQLLVAISWELWLLMDPR